MAARIGTILFDVGGVLVEDLGEQVLAEWITDPHEAERLRSTWFASPSLKAFESGRLSVGAFVESFMAEMALSLDKNLFIEVFSSLSGDLYAEVPPLVESLRGRFTLASLSNTNALHWPRVSAELGLGALLEHHFPSYLTGNLKPEPAAFDQVARRLRREPSTILFLDDQEANVAAARTRGMEAVLVRGPGQARDALEARGLLPGS